VPVRSGAVAEAPAGAHNSQCGATADAAPVELDTEEGADEVPALEVPAPPAAAVGAAIAAVGVAVAPLVVEVVAPAVVAVLAGSPTAAEEPDVRLVPPTEAAVAVCAAAGPASAITSSAMRRRSAMTPPIRIRLSNVNYGA
jgi:hypothetical protein